MDASAFAQDFEALFRETYRRAARRVEDKRARLTPETIALLEHLAMSGPLTPGEMAKHLKRAPSTLSEMLDHLLNSGFMERDRDPHDARKSLVWLSDQGRSALQEANRVLDLSILTQATRGWAPDERATLLRQFESLVTAMRRPTDES